MSATTTDNRQLYSALDAAVIDVTTEAAESEAEGREGVAAYKLQSATDLLQLTGIVRENVMVLMDAARLLPTMRSDDLEGMHAALDALEESTPEGPVADFYLLVKVAIGEAARHQLEILRASEVDLRWGGHVIDAIDHDARAEAKGEPAWLAVCFCETWDLNDRAQTREAAVEAGRRHLNAMGCDPDNFDLHEHSD